MTTRAYTITIGPEDTEPTYLFNTSSTQSTLKVGRTPRDISRRRDNQSRVQSIQEVPMRVDRSRDVSVTGDDRDVKKKRSIMDRMRDDLQGIRIVSRTHKSPAINVTLDDIIVREDAETPLQFNVRDGLTRLLHSLHPEYNIFTTVMIIQMLTKIVQYDMIYDDEEMIFLKKIENELITELQ